MSSTEFRPRAGLKLIGRCDEAAEIHRTLDDGLLGSSTLLIVGEAGSGKTTLLELAHERTLGLGGRLLKTRGSPAVLDQRFVSLRHLVESAPSSAPEAPPAIRAVLRAPASADPAIVGEALLTWFSELAADAPLTVTIDDAQLLDAASGAAINVALRHPMPHRIAILLSSCGMPEPSGITAKLRTIVLSQLEDHYAAQLLDSIADGLTGRTRLEILRQAGGNPLALIEFTRTAAIDSITSMMPQRDTTRGQRINEMFDGRLARLPDATRRLLLYAAATQHGELTAATAAASEDLSAWAPAEQAGLISISGDRVVFQHPLVRSAVYRSAPAADRARAHRDLAELPGLDAIDRARHLARSHSGPDEALAQTLEDAAVYARDRGESYNATRLLERAAENSVDPDTRARRYAEAIRHAEAFGDPQWMSQLYTAVVNLTDDPDIRGRAAVAAGHALALSSKQREAFELLHTTLLWHRPRDRATVLGLTSVLAAVVTQSGIPAQLAGLRRVIETLTESAGENSHELVSACTQAPILECILAHADPSGYAPTIMQDPNSAVHQPLRGDDEALRQICLGAVSWFAGDYHVCVAAFRQALALVGSRPSHGLIVLSVPALASSLIIIGRWSEADELLTSLHNYSVVHRLRHIAADVEALQAELRTLRGNPDPAALDSVWSTLDLTENRSTEARLRRAAGITALADGDPDGAFTHLLALFDHDGKPRDPVVSPRSLADLAAAAVLVGREAEVTPIIEAVKAAYDSPSPSQLRLVLHHATALIAEKTDDLAVETEYRRAAEYEAAADWPFDHAMAQLSYAMWLRRQRRALEARPLLKAALQTSLELGATRLTEFARNELRASGVAVTDQSDTCRLDGLTPQQREVVLLAARGLRNREIGERLFLSPRTVGTHLSNSYQKLGISGRHQLSRVVLSA